MKKRPFRTSKTLAPYIPKNTTFFMVFLQGRKDTISASELSLVQKERFFREPQEKDRDQFLCLL
jgi:hypothetical protein